jgi:hypothetical protein
VRRQPLPNTLNRGYREQDLALAALGPTRPDVPRRRSAVEIAWDTLLWQRTHDERLLADAWDWSRSESSDRGLAALGEFGPQGLGVIAYSRAVRFGTGRLSPALRGDDRAPNNLLPATGVDGCAVRRLPPRRTLC